MAAEAEAGQTFPGAGLMPKRPSEASAFLKQHPEMDGRGVLVAVLDTGVDPGAAGLQRTPDGRKKMVGLLDTSGGGDVDTSKTVNAPLRTEDDGTVVLRGLSARELRLPTGLDNPSGVWHLGVKAAFQLFPSELVRRVKGARKRSWAKQHASALFAARADLAAFDAKHGGDGPKRRALSREMLLDRNELKARVDLLEAAEKEYDDLGPLCDCVVWCGSDSVWRAIVDTASDGDLRSARPLRSFAAYDDGDENQYEFNKWDRETQLNYAVNIFHEGSLLSIVVDSGAHGTHVASIVAGFHPEQPDMNGVAPGAQIVSMKIGDGRLDGMETTTSIIRALNACANLGVDVINMSFGEPSSLPDSGRISELARELVERHGVVFVSSAGNAGPALSTIGAPGATSDALIGVGAYVEPEMMLAAYAIKPGTTPPPNLYTWSSRGPAYDGHIGVTIAAPGAAITSVPEWTLAKSRLMNGTSMSSPNAAGGIALIISGLKQLGIKYSPWELKRAIQGTAVPVPGVEMQAQGRGLLQVNKAFEAMRLPSVGVHSRALYRVLVTSHQCRASAGPAKGIYLREPWETCAGGVKEFMVSVTPVFPERPKTFRPELEEWYDQRVSFEKADRVAFEVRLNIRCSQPWISAPPYLLLNAASRSFRVSVDLGALPTSRDGSPCVPCGFVEAYDPREPAALGPLWSVPVTVVRPERCDAVSQGSVLADPDDILPPAASVGRLAYQPTKEYLDVNFEPGKIVRHFISVPAGATWMDLSLEPGHGRSSVPDGSSRIFYVHCLQMRSQSQYKHDKMGTSVQLRQEAGMVATRSMAVDEHGTVEICVAQFWNSLGTGPVSIKVRFNGVTATPCGVSLSGSAAGVARVNLRADLGIVRVSPQARLKRWCRSVRPTPGLTKIEAMPNGTRDAILGAYPPETRPTYGLWLTYTFKQSEKGKLTPRLPRVDQFLYESPVDSLMCLLFDSDKQLLNCSDAWPTAVEVPKGDITARVLVRHEDRSVLLAYEDMPLVVERPLPSDITVPAYSTYPRACSAGSTFSQRLLNRGESCVVFFAAPQWKEVSKKLPKGVAPGDCLCGTVQYGKRSSRDTGLSGTDKRPGGYRVEWHIDSIPDSPPDEPSLKDDGGEAAAGNGKQDVNSSAESGDDTAAANGSEDPASDGKTAADSSDKLRYKHLVQPKIRARLKALEDLRKGKGKLGAAERELLAELDEEVAKALEEARALSGLSGDATVTEELAAWDLQRVRSRLLASVREYRAALEVQTSKRSTTDGSQGTDEPSSGLDDVASACDAVIAAIDPDALAMSLIKFKQAGDLDGVGQSDAAKEAQKKAQEKRQHLVEAMVLKLYATRFAPNAELEGQLARVAEGKDLGVAQLRADRHAYFGRVGSALQVLQSKLTDPEAKLDGLPLPCTSVEVQETRARLYEAAGWTHMATRLRESELPLRRPAAFVPF